MKPRDFQTGAAASLPLAVSAAAYGSVLGVFAAQKQMTLLTLLVMDVSIFAGAAQFVMVDMWTPPLPVMEMTLAVLAVNMRYFLIGASMEPVLSASPAVHKYPLMHLVVDENWALTMAEYRMKGGAGLGFILGSGICLMIAWCGGTAAGYVLGEAIRNPAVYALDFAFVAVFTALTTSLWRGRKDLAPWVAAAVVAVLVERMIPGKWYVVAGGVAGGVAAIFSEGT